MINFQTPIRKGSAMTETTTAIKRPMSRKQALRQSIDLFIPHFLLYTVLVGLGFFLALLIGVINNPDALLGVVVIACIAGLTAGVGFGLYRVFEGTQSIYGARVNAPRARVYMDLLDEVNYVALPSRGRRNTVDVVPPDGKVLLDFDINKLRPQLENSYLSSLQNEVLNAEDPIATAEQILNRYGTKPCRAV